MTGMADVSAASSWGEIYARLLAADRESPLGPEDLARLADRRLPDRQGAGERRASGPGRTMNFWPRPAGGGRPVAFWLAFGLLDKGELAQGSGWLARARRLLDECGQRLCGAGLPAAARGAAVDRRGRLRARRRAFRLAAAVGERFGDAGPRRAGPAWPRAGP